MEKQTSIDWFIDKLPIRMKNYLSEEIETVRKMHKEEIEISDEEIDNASLMISNERVEFIKGAKWYREQLKKKL